MRTIFLIALLLTPNIAMAQAPPTPVIPTSGVAGSDPTKNVLDKVLDAVTRLNDLMLAARERTDGLREADQKYNASMRDAEAKLNAALREVDTKRVNELRDAETRRINELNTQKQIFDLELARVIRAGQDSSTLLLAGAVKEVKSDSSERFAKLEQFANEQRGRASGQGESSQFIWAIIGAIGLIGGLIVGILGAFRNKPRVEPIILNGNGKQ